MVLTICPSQCNKARETKLKVYSAEDSFLHAITISRKIKEELILHGTDFTKWIKVMPKCSPIKNLPGKLQFTLLRFLNTLSLLPTPTNCTLIYTRTRFSPSQTPGMSQWACKQKASHLSGHGSNEEQLGRELLSKMGLAWVLPPYSPRGPDTRVRPWCQQHPQKSPSISAQQHRSQARTIHELAGRQLQLD